MKNKPKLDPRLENKTSDDITFQFIRDNMNADELAEFNTPDYTVEVKINQNLPEVTIFHDEETKDSLIAKLKILINSIENVDGDTPVQFDQYEHEGECNCFRLCDCDKTAYSEIQLYPQEVVQVEIPPNGKLASIQRSWTTQIDEYKRWMDKYENFLKSKAYYEE